MTDVVTMWNLCRYEASLSNDFSHFCSLWTEDDISDLAYLEDLQTYYQSGYGNTLNWMVASQLMINITSNIFSSFAQVSEMVSQCGKYLPIGRTSCVELLKNAQFQKAASFRFATSETLIPVLAWLGLFATPSDIMKHDTPVSVREQRNWRTSRMAEYSANLLFLSYVCSERDTLLKVVFNEDEVTLPGCDGMVYCNMSTFVREHERELNINYDEICGIRRQKM